VNNLRDSEQKWTAYRDAACNTERGLGGKGSGAPGAWSGCMIRVTKQRVADLKKAYLFKHWKAKSPCVRCILPSGVYTNYGVGYTCGSGSPVILNPDNYDLWLDPGMQNVSEASELLMPFDPRRMRCYPVSTRINHVANDDEECSRPIEVAEIQNRLFL